MPSVYKSETLVYPIKESEIADIVFLETDFVKQYTSVRVSNSYLCRTFGNVTVDYDRTIDGQRTHKSVTFFKEEVEQILQEHFDLDSGYKLRFDNWNTKSWSLVKDVTPYEPPRRKRTFWDKVFGRA